MGGELRAATDNDAELPFVGHWRLASGKNRTYSPENMADTALARSVSGSRVHRSILRLAVARRIVKR